jgi:formylglycine-generating enzyme required for sulfatase activity
MEASLTIRGKVTGRMLAGAMIRAQAIVTGGIKAKQAAGVGRYCQYLDGNSARNAAWQKATGLSPSAILARASLSRTALEKAGRLFERTSDVEQRRALLGRVIAPHLLSGVTLFGRPVSNNRPITIEAEALVDLLSPELPGLELRMIKIPGGKFPLGTYWNKNERFTDDDLHDVKISSFSLGKYEVTNAQYGIFMGQTAAAEPLYWKDEDLYFGKDPSKNPVVGVNYYAANVFASWLGMRLPTEAEGEYAARGPKGLEYPWGHEWRADRATFHKNGTRPVDAHKKAPSPFGAKDLSGNVWEWRSDWYRQGYDPKDLVNPQGPKRGTYRVFRGGCFSSFHSSPNKLRSAYRGYERPGTGSEFLGFRVAEDLGP